MRAFLFVLAAAERALIQAAAVDRAFGEHMQSIEDIFNDTPEAEDIPEHVEVQESASVESPGVKQEEVPPTPEKTVEDRMVPLKAMEDVRHKWQEAQAELQELRAKLAPQEQKKAPDVFEDPEGYQKHVTNLLEQSRLQDRIALSREMLLMVKEDYEQRETEFLELAKQDDSLIQKMTRSSNPAKFVYETAVKAEKAKAMEDVEGFEAKIRAEVEAKIRAEIKAESESNAAKTAKKDAAITPNLTKARATATMDYEADESLEALLKR